MCCFTHVRFVTLGVRECVLSIRLTTLYAPQDWHVAAEHRAGTSVDDRALELHDDEGSAINLAGLSDQIFRAMRDNRAIPESLSELLLGHAAPSAPDRPAR